MSEAFVYCWYNEENKKKYIGYHKGNIDDGYVCSSKSTQFWKDYNAGKLKRQIIAHGTTKDCQRLERKIFENIDWKSDEYYNLAVGGSVLYSLNNPMFREENKEYFSRLHKNDPKRKERAIGNQYAKGTIRSDKHKEILRQKAINDNPMSKPEFVEKVRLSKVGTKALYKDGRMKKAKPNTDMWNQLINSGWKTKS